MIIMSRMTLNCKITEHTLHLRPLITIQQSTRLFMEITHHNGKMNKRKRKKVLQIILSL